MVETDLKLKIKQAIVAGLQLKRAPESIPDDAPLFCGGLNLESADKMAMVVVLEERFNVKIKDTDIEKLNSVNQIADYLIDKSL